jgi:hypothetical protein
MICDFPEAKKEIKKTIDAVLRQQVKQKAPLFSMVNKRTLFEGDKLSVLHTDGERVVKELSYIESQFFIPHKDIPILDQKILMEKVSGAAEDMAGQMERGMFKEIDASMTESGNIIPGNPEIGPDSILKALEMIFIDFEDDDRMKPIKPSIITGPAAFEKLKELEAKVTPEEKEQYQKKEEIILDKKYQEYLQDLRSRKIVD